MQSFDDFEYARRALTVNSWPGRPVICLHVSGVSYVYSEYGGTYLEALKTREIMSGLHLKLAVVVSSPWHLRIKHGHSRRLKGFGLRIAKRMGEITAGGHSEYSYARSSFR